MLIPILIFVIAAICLFFIINSISTNRARRIKKLELQKLRKYQQYEQLRKQRIQLRIEITEKEQALAALRKNQAGITTISANELDLNDVDENVKIGRYLIQEGKITREQNAKVLGKINVMQMDYLGSCLALGFIDLETAKKAIKINRVTTNSFELN
ncbi:hypothetical protein [Pseudodesulfovibrio piezophilus]|uniref:Uncharacterized protein n=1 Tax=Pseudodesulfovibrio piezophilus (strain DSM 21447 / JCM 15486 / C1TLV30) TaxID=1322246 RepID=M1WJ65_PSEP2|nr:hypothetical protein [Pseudodesulfovibrio piezophilus]CCH47356.1 conserved protein of unknown function [Pseudodesulfovibrio piezophilus C1TLV30]